MSQIVCFPFAPKIYQADEWMDAPSCASSTPRDLSILTWNVWFGGHMFEERRGALLAELERRRPDVIALQEVTQDLLDYLVAESWVRSSYQITELEICDYDVLILSRIPIVRAFEVVLPTQMGRRLIDIELACGLTVATVHLESTSEEAATRASQLQIIQPSLVEHSANFVLVGDMNFSPGAALEEQTLDPTLVDVWNALRPTEPGYTVDTEINSMRFQIKRRRSQKRIDRVFVRSSLWRPLSIEMVGTQPIHSDGTFISDHFGLETVFSVE